jgi:tyrosyl-tRNA synthetase
MYGALMAQADENMQQLFEDCTWLHLTEINDILSSNGPRDAKMRLAKEITKIYHGEAAAIQAEDNFIRTFQNKEIPEDILEFKTNAEDSLIEILTKSGIATSKSDARRGAIKMNGEKVTIEAAETPIGPITEKTIVQKGKRHFISLV